MSTALLGLSSAPLQALATHVMVRAEAMGLLPESSSGMIGGFRDAVQRLREVLDNARQAGIARALTTPEDSADEERWGEFARVLLDALEESPLPQAEWSGLERVLGADLVASLVNVSTSSQKRYAAGTRPTPDDVAARLHLLALIVADLAGSYNDLGVRRWFARPRAQLDGKPPAALLEGEWDPEAEGPRKVRQLAAALLGSPAT